MRYWDEILAASLLPFLHSSISSLESSHAYRYRWRPILELAGPRRGGSAALTARYGPDIVIAHGGAPGVDQSFSTACRHLGVKIDCYLADFSHLGDHRFRNREMLRAGTALCLIFHRSVLDDASNDLTRQAIAAGVPTNLIDSEDGKPKDLLAGDARLR